MVKARKYVVNKYFKGVPERSDFEVMEYELPPLKDEEILVKAEWISVDPYMRYSNSTQTVPYDQAGYQIGIVQESKSPQYPVGTRVVTYKGWRDYSIASTKPSDDPMKKVYQLPDLQGLSTSLGLGVLGMIGATAYFGFLEICKPKAGEIVVVTTAAGAVGSLVGQIAKIYGCYVIGFTGSDVKVQVLEQELGFDKAFNYKTVDIAKVVAETAPGGVDCYFDNVGGEMSSVIISKMNDFGRVSVCGSISSYNDDLTQVSKATILQPALVFKQVRIEGFMCWRWIDTWVECLPHLIGWIKSGKLKAKEHIYEGFDNIFDAFAGMLAGENVGKVVIKV